MNTTVRMKASDISKDWHVIDAAGRPLGRVATEAATLLRGKHKPTFEPHLDGGDFVIVVNAARVKVSGNKSQTMVYYRHSGYPGGLKSRTFEEQMERFPDKVIERAVHGMLPKGSLGQQMRKHLKVYAGPDHPHEAQVTGSDKAKAKRDEANPDGPRLRRVVPGFAPARTGAANADALSRQTELDEELDQDVAAEIEPELETASVTEAPAVEADASGVEQPADGATGTGTAEPTATQAAPRAPRRRARKTEATEDSEE